MIAPTSQTAAVQIFRDEPDRRSLSNRIGSYMLMLFNSPQPSSSNSAVLILRDNKNDSCINAGLQNRLLGGTSISSAMVVAAYKKCPRKSLMLSAPNTSFYLALIRNG